MDPGIQILFNISSRINLFNHIITGAVKPLRLQYFNYSVSVCLYGRLPLNLMFAFPLSTAPLKL